MSDYTKSTDFASKDSLPTGNSAKIVKGTEIDTEFNNIATAIATKANSASPSFSGTAAFATLTATSATITSATISGGSVTGITDITVADGGTGASTAANARANLGTVADTASNGIAARTAANTLTARTITAGTGISVSNGDGVSGNPTISNTGVTTVNGSSGAVTINQLTSGTSVTVSGTSIDFTSIPSWVRRVKVLFNNVITSGTAIVLVRLGTSSGIVSSGYVGNAGATQGSVTGSAAYTTGFGTTNATNSGTARNGSMTIELLTGTTYIQTGIIAETVATRISYMGGAVSLGDVLTTIRITTNGSDTFTSGSINILYE